MPETGSQANIGSGSDALRDSGDDDALRDSGDDAVLRDATELLRAELPDDRLADDTAYLRWCYRENPLGRAWERYHYVKGTNGEPLLVAHYLNIPRRYRGPAGVRSDGAWSQHAVTRSGYQRARHFTRLGLEIYDEAARAGRSFVVGVTNDKSTGPVVKYMGWRLVGPLPVRVVLAVGSGLSARRRSRSMRSFEVTRDWLDSADFDDFAANVDRHSVTGWSTDWAADVLRWRLSCPFVRYWVHLADDMAAITTVTRHVKLPVTVVLKLFPLVKRHHGEADTATTSVRLDATGMIAKIARRHRSVFAVYAGFNGSVRVRGLAPPRRLLPSPLNLIVRSLDPTVNQDELALDTFEFLDMDAY